MDVVSEDHQEKFKLKIRHQYLLRLIACYRNHFEQGKMMPATLLILLDASKKALEDLSADDFSGWSHVK